ncbi:MAG TPA: response regulator, partial [Myxococcaceae bacterium]|nr:response regulator [Myxococcaceae bacterium]
DLLRTPSIPLTVVADPGRLTQVFNNLLTNAVKFTTEGGSIQVELFASAAAPGFAALAVENSGDPIAEADLERIFDKFEQARNARTRTVSGTGLGLAISRSIAEAHGGRIWAEMVPRGARFVMVVPVEPSAEVLEGAPEQPAVPAGLARTASVLLVEDDPETAYVLKAMLMSRHHRVLIAGTGEEALSLARRYRPDVMAVDFRLPDIDGFHLAEVFRNDPDTRHAPILVLSALDERQRALRLGVDAFLQKPLYADKFLATLDALIRGKAGRRGGRVLAVDDDEKIREICREVLANIGFEVDVAGSLAEARRKLSEKRPDVMLLDVMLPDGDGFSLLEELKAERASRNLSVIFVSARTETQAKVRALKLGGDDYLTKPFDALELGARVEAVIRRKEQEQGWSPTTQLPGSAAIEREVLRRLQARQPFAFCYLDLDNLKAFNDYYGYAKADGVIRQTGDLLREIISQEGRPDDFLGHVAGDDFVFVTDPSSVDRVCQRAIESFDRIIPLYYDRTDRERGHIDAEDRFGQRRQFPVMSVSIVAVMSDGVSTGHAELARVAAEMKKRAKAIQGSVYIRSDREPATRSVAG